MMIVSRIFNLFTAPLEFIYWLKWVVSYVAIRAYNAFQCKRFALYDLDALGDPVKLGFLIPNIEKELESPFPESHLQEAADEVAIYGVNSQSECLLVRIARGSNQQADAWIYLKLANGKTYYLMETKGFQQSVEGNSQIFSCGKLQMHYLGPMRKWRIFYCGMLKEISDNDKKSEEVVFAKFVFLWKAASDVYDCTLDTNLNGFANAMARSDWRVPLVPPIKNLVDALNIYGQSGVISGTVSINDGSDYEMYLFGAKIRSLGKSASIAGCKFTSILGCTPSNGLNFQLSNVSVPYSFKNLPFGFVVDPDGMLEPLKDLDITIKPVTAKKQKNSFKASFAAGQQYELSGSISEPIVFYSGQGWSGFLELSYIEFNVGDRKGYGLIMSGEVYNIPKRTGKPLSIIRSCPEPIPLTVPFTDEACQFGEVSGGKGSSLGKLTELSQEDKTFTVPKGIVVTTSAYKQFLTSEILEAVKYLEKVVYGIESGDIKNACQRVSSVIEKTCLPNKICQSIIQDLKDIFGDEVNYRKFAVRSSATGEDTSTMSAAGQMDTFLGVQGLNEIFSAVKNCWASQFGHIAVEYKRRNGQILNSPMAVVIQDMVACDISGVLFTCDPVTNNPSIITITANYGLGETVVSGSVEPDTILLRKKADGILEVEEIVIGSKLQKIIMKDSGGTVTEDIDDHSKMESCVSKEDAERLGKLSLKIENYYKSSRDIEWGMLNGKIYILQSRPVTNAAAETDNEIKHEFDAPLRCENEYFTVANVGEVMPGASSPLGVDLLSKCFSNVLKREASRKGAADNLLSSRYYPNGLLTFCNHMMMPVVEMLIRYGFDTPKSKGLMVSVFGRVLDDPDLMSYARERAKEGEGEEPSFISKIRQQLKDYWYLYTFDFGLEKVKERTFNYKLNFLKKDTAKETFAAMLSACSDFDDSIEKHIDASTSSSDWNMIMFNILCEAKGSFDIDVYSDFARLLATSSDVESANVPQAMQEVANQVVKDIGQEKFSSMSVEEATEWLQTTTAPSGYKFRQFLNRHGHRCLKEFDVRSITWEMDPKLLVHLLQSIAGISKEDSSKKEESIDNIFSQLNVPLSFISRWKLKFVLPNCRRGVRARETTKSLSIKSFDHWRKGVRRLGKQMVTEGRLPDEELIFFLTLDEINDILNTRSPTLISKASHRKKIFSTLENYKFPEIMKGIPKPINDEEESADTYEFIADLTMKGTPVSVGVTKGYARVAVSLEEASHVQPGEILITYSTDIGWSPYFPIVSGVVTELGGLISHGAVVSREYGLPCVVGLQGATKKFQTGDYVLLDGKKGILQRLPKPE